MVEEIWTKNYPLYEFLYEKNTKFNGPQLCFAESDIKKKYVLQIFNPLWSHVSSATVLSWKL